GAGGPSQRNTDERLILRLNQVRLEMFVRPAAAEGSPLFFLGRKAVLGHALDDPNRRGLVIGRAGEARTVDVRQVKHVVHHFRVFESFGLDAIDYGKIDLLGGEQQQRNAGSGNSDYRAELLGEWHKDDMAQTGGPEVTRWGVKAREHTEYEGHRGEEKYPEFGNPLPSTPTSRVPTVPSVPRIPSAGPRYNLG